MDAILETLAVERWFCFDVRRAGRSIYVGKSLTTEREIRATFAGCLISGNHVLILSRP